MITISLVKNRYLWYKRSGKVLDFNNKKRRGVMMLTDVEIAQSASMLPIKEIAQKVGLDEDD